MQISSYPRLRPRSDNLKATLNNHALLVGIGSVLWLVSVGRIAAYGFSWHSFVLWLAALVSVAQLARLAQVSRLD